MKKLISIFKIGFNSYKYLPFIVLLVPILVYLFFYKYIHLNQKVTFWDSVIDPTLSVSGFILPAFIWLYYIFNKDWRDGLGKRLNVHFVLNEKYVMSCLESNLSSEGDIRNWGQQIGSQMNGGNNLSFFPFIKYKPATEQYDNRRKEYYLLYEITFFLKFENDNYCPPKNTTTVFDESKYTIWIDNNYDSPSNKQIVIDKSDKPISIEEALEIYRQGQTT